MRTPRVLIVVAATAICAWFVIGIRQAHEVGAATVIVSNGPSAGARQLAHAGSLLSSASFLNPDRVVDILRGRLAIAEHHLPQARRILEAVTRSEPLNLDGWIWLTGAALTNPREAKTATSHIAELDPRDAARL